MRRIFLTIEYDGTPFVGWQRQINGMSVQQVIEEAASSMMQQDALVQGAGRTDSGVHATGQVAHIDVPDKFTANRVQQAINALIGAWPVSITAAREVSPDSHARFSAITRNYLYRIIARRHPPALDQGRVWHHRQPLDAALMNAGAKHLIGTHDFTSFRATQCQADSPVRTMDDLRVEQVGEEIHIHASARSFLHHQIRNITGTLALVGTKKWAPDDVVIALAAHDRAAAGPKAPPEGLYLTRVGYPETL